MSHTVCAYALYEAVTRDTSKYLTSYQSNLIENGIIDWPGQTLKERQAASLRYSLLRKFVPNTRSLDAPNQVALEKFLRINSDCESWRLEIPSLLHELIIGEMKNIIYSFWFNNADRTRSLESHPFDSLDRGRMGPGASYDVPGTDFYTKLFSAPMTSTSRELILMYKHYSSKQPSWREAEKLRTSIYGEPRVVDGNRLAYVPKNRDVSRTICVEPSLNMFFQLGFGSILEERLRSFFGIDLSTQPTYNRELARVGSMSNQLSTIDLASASDSLSLRMLTEMLPKSFMDRLVAYRSILCDLPGGTKVPLQMVSTMGNGYTFPLQTMLFSSCVMAVYKVLGLPFSGGPNGTFGVFGDDIICLKQASNAVISTLQVLGFKTNLDKSFTDGSFRESCGGDFFLGVDVRGVYVKDLSTPISAYVAFNRLNSFSAKSGISLRDSVSYIGNSVKYLPVPEWENDDAGHRLPLFLVNKVKRDKNGSYTYYRNTPKPSYLIFEEERIKQPGWSKKHPRIYNPEGALLTFLVGGIVNSKIALRSATNNYSRRRSVAPSWEMTESDAAKAGLRPGRWRTACATNFGW